MYLLYGPESGDAIHRGHDCLLDDLPLNVSLQRRGYFVVSAIGDAGVLDAKMLYDTRHGRVHVLRRKECYSKGGGRGGGAVIAGGWRGVQL